MVSGLKAFLKQNKKGEETKDVLLPSFEEPVEIRVLSAREADLINDRCFVNKPGRNGRQERVFDGVKYNREICIASIVVPDLNDKELQDSYGTMGASELFGTMFNWGESALILEAVTELSGINQTFQDKVDEAKN